MFTGIDIIAILVAVGFIFYLAGPEMKEFKLEADPLVIMVVLITIAMFIVSM